MPGVLEDKTKDFVREKDGRVFVDWQGLAQLKKRLIRDSDGSRSFDPIFGNILDYLTANGVLTFSHENSWTLTDGIADLSPSKGAPHSPCYFTRREDAENYKAAFYKHNAIPVSVRLARETV